MKTTAIKVMATVMTVAAIVVSFAEDESPVYITGAEYTIEGTTLAVTSGDGVLVAQTPDTIVHLRIAEEASLKLGIDNPFGANHALHVFGKLDVNGKTFSALRIASAGSMEDSLRSTHGRIVNTSSTDSEIITLTSTAGSNYYGTFEEAPGKIRIVSCVSNPFNMTGLTESSDSLSFIAMTGDSQLQVLDRANFVKFVFYPPVDATKPMRLGEISMTYRGAPVAIARAEASSTTDDQSGAVWNLIDDRANSHWQAGEAGEQTITLYTSDLAGIDGYRITPFDGTDGDTSYRPSGWDVYVKRTPAIGWILVDSRRNWQWYSRQKTSASTNIYFSAKNRPGNPFKATTEISVSSKATAFRVSSTGPMAFGKLAGSGGVSIEDGSVFAPGDLSDYAGTFTASARKAYLTGSLALTASGGAEQVVSIASAQNLAVVNGGTEPVSVLLDDTRAGEHLFGKLSDGENGPLGLVKRGSGERVIETEDASYTGPTVVHGGKLTVARKRSSVTARYIRITPLTVSGTDASFPWAMHEFLLLDENGNAVPWPTGATVTKPANTQSHADAKLIDGDISTRLLMGKYTDGTSGYAPATINAGQPVTFSSYKWWSGHRHEYDVTRRLPTSWKIEISDTGMDGSWTTIDVDSYPMSQEDINDYKATTARLSSSNWAAAGSGDDLNGLPRGSFSLDGSAQSSGTVFSTLGESLFASGTTRDTHRKLKAQYIRFTVYETFRPDADENAWGWQLSEISLMKDGARIPWPAATTSSLTGSSVFAGHQSNLCNNVLSYGDGSAGNSDRCVIRGMPSYVVINAHEVLEFDAYSLTSTSVQNSQHYRLPRTWKMEVSFDGSTYHEVDVMRNYEPTEDVLTKTYQELGPFPVAEKWPLLDLGAGDSLGDTSPVTIDADATLKLATDYEKFGPLSGAGTVELEWGAVGEINAMADATFSGGVTGRGTLAVCGTNTQTFAGATLSGAETLELNGGAIAGAATFGGKDVTVAFNGGATRAALSGIGTLTVTGNVKYAIPDVSNVDSYAVTLFMATAIPAESKALLQAGAIEGEVPRNWKCGVTVTDTTVTLYGHRRGLLISIQ